MTSFDILGKTDTVLEKNKRLSQTLLWKIQRTFFDQQGIEAWNTGKVPHYATSNPYIAKAYSKVVLGFLHDYIQTEQLSIDLTQPIYIVELGAGSGRFAYHFLKHFFQVNNQTLLEQISVKYIMTDLAQQNLDFWQSHPSLEPFVNQGRLDFARFDVGSDNELKLLNSEQILSRETLKNPLVIIANYFFDSVAQDLFYIKDRQLYETRLTLSTSVKNPDPVETKPLSALHIDYTDHVTTADDYYDDPALNQVLKTYQHQFTETSLLFPYLGLNCLSQLRQLSDNRLLVLSGDKGYCHENNLCNRKKPQLAFHKGCFSLMVNYHAFGQYVQNQGGYALLPDHHPRSINVCAFLFGDENQPYVETHHAYQAVIQESGPDDFFTLKKIIEPHFNSLTLEQILAYLRLSGWDSKIFLGCFSALMQHVEKASEVLCQDLYIAVQKVWETYYYIGEKQDLPFHLSMLLYKMEHYDRAIFFIDRSLELYGEDPGMYHNKALSYIRLQQLDNAVKMLDKALELLPKFESAQDLRRQLITLLAA